MGSGEHQLNFLIKTDNLKLLKTCIANGVNVNNVGISTISPLQIASQMNNTNTVVIVKSLLDAKANIDYRRCGNCNAAIHDAAFEGCKEVLALLIARKADINLKGYADKTALWCAVESAEPVKISALLDAGAYMNITDNSKEHIDSLVGESPTIKKIFSKERQWRKDRVNILTKAKEYLQEIYNLPADITQIVCDYLTPAKYIQPK